jgi:hypothetical protein
MSGLLRRLTRRGPATADENRSPAIESSDPAAAPAETPAEPGGQSTTSVWAGHARPAEAAADQPSAAATGDQPSDAATGDQPSATASGDQPADAATGGGPSATAAAGESPTVVLPATGEQPLPAWTVAASQPTAFAAQPAPPRDLPAGVDPGDLAAAPAASARRGKLRRRLRYLRHVRELLLRDLGGFTYEVHRTAGGTAQEPHRRLATAKAERISKLDEEVLALESRLGQPHAEVVLREPGIGGTCRECGELHASDAHFCARCGAPLDAEARAQRATAAPTTDSHTAAEPQPASVLWAGGPRPVPEAAAEEPEPPQPPSEVTSQWLATDEPTTLSRTAQPDERAVTGDARAVNADEPAAIAKTDEPAKADEPAAIAKTDEPAKADEPAAIAKTDGPAKADEPAARTDEPAEPAKAKGPALDEPATVVDVSEPGEPADEPATSTDEPARSADAPATSADAPAKAEGPALDEPAKAADVPEPGEPAAAPPRAKPKRVSNPGKRAPSKPRPKKTPEPPSFRANGRRDEDVPPPDHDPFASPREQGQ